MIFPAITETLVLPIDSTDVEQRIKEGIENKKFNGIVGGRKFSLSACLIRPPQFSPMVRGRIDASSRGSLVFLKYELMPATKGLIGFFLVMAILISAQAAFMRTDVFYIFLPIALAIALRAVALTNIRLHRDPVRQNLLDILS